jgi:GTP-binding nuclear protein Ran
LYVARKLTGNVNCHFKEAPALAPPTVTIDPAQIKAMEENVRKAAQAPLPDEDDD